MLFKIFEGSKEASLVVKHNVKSRHWMTHKIVLPFKAHMNYGYDLKRPLVVGLSDIQDRSAEITICYLKIINI
jgi:hypothetical protein